MDILNLVNTVNTVELDTRMLRLNEQGKIEVLIDEYFQTALNQLFAELFRQQAHPIPAIKNNEKMQSELRSIFQELSNQLIHRIKTDLNTQEVCVLHFALIKAVLQHGRDALNNYIAERKERVNELKWHGSSELLKAQDHVSWLHKNSEHIIYRVQSIVFKELLRVECKQLRSVWDTLQGMQLSSAQVLLSPSLYSPNLQSSSYQLEQFYLWESEQKKFSQLNNKLEQLLSKKLGDFPLLPFQNVEQSQLLKSHLLKQDRTTLCLQYLGKPLNRQASIIESFNWLDNPDIIEKLFHPEVHQENFWHIRKTEGLKPALKYAWQARKLNSILRSFSRLLDKEGLLKECIASNKTFEIWPQSVNRQISCLKIYRVLLGNDSIADLQKSLPAGIELNSAEIRRLKESAKTVNEEYKNEHWLNSLKALQNIALFRQQIKCFHFAYSIFDRIILMDKKEGRDSNNDSSTIYAIESSSDYKPARPSGNNSSQMKKSA